MTTGSGSYLDVGGSRTGGAPQLRIPRSGEPWRYPPDRGWAHEHHTAPPPNHPRRCARLSGSPPAVPGLAGDRKRTRLNSSHVAISYAVLSVKNINQLVVHIRHL